MTYLLSVKVSTGLLDAKRLHTHARDWDSGAWINPLSVHTVLRLVLNDKCAY